MSDMIRASSVLRRLGAGAESMEEVADRIVHYLHDELVDPSTGAPACALVRCYATRAYGDVAALAAAQTDVVATDVRCLVLLATAADEEGAGVDDVGFASGVIPLPDAAAVERIPMLAEVLRQFGLRIGNVIARDPAALEELEYETSNVFYVAEAAGSPYVQHELVARLGVRSVLGFGDGLTSGNVFAVLLFSKIRIPPETADLFKTLALSAKMAMLPVADGRTFTDVARR
ncbi:MAG: hypothetical protein HYX76_03100 [Acidobacteria bacterium]|nr:hypothetical protein [Acidobacteriota bacterium]